MSYEPPSTLPDEIFGLKVHQRPPRPPLLHHYYISGLLFSIVLQWLDPSFSTWDSRTPLRLALVPIIAYWIITPVIIFRRRVPTTLDVIMVFFGYIFYWWYAILFHVAVGIYMGKLK